MRILVVLVCLLWAAPAAAANWYQRQGGSTTPTTCGADWSSACASLEDAYNRAARGDTIYLADSTGTSADDNATGNLATGSIDLVKACVGACDETDRITIQKATVAAHGTDTGWINGYGDGQTVFTSPVWVCQGYVTIDGVTGGGPGPLANWTTGYGIKFDAAKALVLGHHSTSIAGGACNTATGFIVQHFEADGAGADGNSAGDNDLVWICDGCDGLILRYAYLHNGGRCLLFSRRSDNGLVEFVYAGTFESVGVEHAETFDIGNTGNRTDYASNWIIRYSIIADAGTLGTGATGQLMFNGSGLQAYGNVFVNLGAGGWCCNGAIATWSWGRFDNVAIYNNSFINIGTAIGATGGGTAPSSGFARNNIFYSTENMTATRWGNLVHTHNLYAGGTTTTPADSAGGASMAGNPFTNYLASDFSLTMATAAGFTLSSPYTSDYDGCMRGGDGTWDRGAEEFGTCSGGGGNTPPAISFATPSAAEIAETTSTSLSIGGTASDSGGSVVSSVAVNSAGGAITMGGTPTAWTGTGTYTDYAVNILTTTATDNLGAVNTDTLSVLVTTVPATPQDTFAANWTGLGPLWTCVTTTCPTRSGGQAVGASGPNFARWSASAVDDDQYVQVTVKTVGANTRYAQVAGRSTGTGATLTHYRLNTDGTSGDGHTQLGKVVNNVYTKLAHYTTTFADGEVLRLEITGTTPTTIRALKGSTPLAPSTGGTEYVDASAPLTTGGIDVGFSGAAAADNFLGGDFVPSPGDSTPPVVAITAPVSAVSYNTGTSPITTLAGTAADVGGTGVASCSCAVVPATSCTVMGAAPTWTIATVALTAGLNTVTVACLDVAGNPGADVLEITYTPPDPPDEGDSFRGGLRSR